MLKELCLMATKVTDAGCAALAAALDGGAQLPALEKLSLSGTIQRPPPTGGSRRGSSAAARAAVQEALARSRSMSVHDLERLALSSLPGYDAAGHRIVPRLP